MFFFPLHHLDFFCVRLLCPACPAAPSPPSAFVWSISGRPFCAFGGVVCSFSFRVVVWPRTEWSLGLAGTPFTQYYPASLRGSDLSGVWPTQGPDSHGVGSRRRHPLFVVDRIELLSIVIIRLRSASLISILTHLKMSHPTTTTTPAIVPGAGDSSSKATPTATSTDKQPERNSWFRGCVILADRS